MFKKVLGYAGNYRKLTFAATLLILVAVVMGVLPFLFLYQLITPILTGGTLTVADVLWRVLAILVCCVLNAVLYVKGLALSHEAAYHTLENVRVSLQGKMEKQPLGTIQGYGVGSIKKMFIDDIENIELLLAHAIPEGIGNVAVPVFSYVAMFIVDWKLALLSLASLPLGFLAMGAMYKSGMGKMAAYYGSAQKMNNTIVEYINGMEVVKVFNRGGESYKRFETDVHNYKVFTLDWFRECWPWMAAYTSVLPCVALLTLPLGSWFVLTGLSTLPHLVLTLCLCFGVGAPLVRAVGFMSAMPQVNFKLDALEKMMSAPPLQETDKPFAGKNLDVDFENVRFSYKEDEVLHGVSLHIPQGSMTALVGESGSGKSTLAKLLVHFYDVTGGAVKLGGQDVREMSLEALNNQVSFVAQEQFLFNTSLMDNIRLGKLDATDEEVLAAAEKAQCGEFLERLPEGIHTLAGDGGKMLSGGERQRISLARAILKNAPVVVLDEATAFLDPENEAKMNEAIAQVIRGKTVIVIAHRLPSIMNADQICVLKEGCVVAVGNHQELLKICPAYKTLWQAAEDSAQWAVAVEKGGERA